MERILSLIGLAHKAGRVEIGEEPVGSAARARHARIILVAGDAAAGTVRRAQSFARSGECLCLIIPAEKDQLGRALGRSSCAMAAITDIGFADAVAKKLAALRPQEFSEASERMALKAQRARERQKEQLAHEKNVRQGKRRAKAPAEPAPERKKAPVKDAERPARGRSPFKKAVRGPEGAAPEAKKPTRTEGKRSPAPKRDRAAAARQRGKAETRQRFLESRPVKKGKGSRQKNK